MFYFAGVTNSILTHLYQILTYLYRKTSRLSLLFFFCVPICLFHNAYAQEIWDLPKCIAYAIENNIDIQLQKTQIKSAEVDVKQNVYNAYPTVSASIQPNLRGGQQLSPTNTGFINQTINTIGFGVNGSGNIFNFGAVKKNIDASKYSLSAMEESLKKAQNDISLNVANAYIGALLSKKQQEIFDLAIQQDQYNIDLTQKLIDIGERTEFDLVDFYTQLATDSSNYQNAYLQYEQNVLNLKILINLDPNTDINIKDYNTDSFETSEYLAINPSIVFDSAYNLLPQKNIAKYNIRAAEKTYEAARTNLLPSLNYSFGTNTNYTFGLTSIIPAVKTDFFSQLSNFNNYFLGLGINIPIYNAWNNKGPIKKAKLQVLYQEQLGRQQINQLKQEVYLACQSSTNAYETYRANLNVYEKSLKSLEGAKLRYEAGILGVNEYINQQNRTARAKLQSISSYYDFIFKSKIIDFYLGKTIVL